MKRSLLILIPALVLLFAVSCRRHVVKGTGTTGTETRQSQPFTTISVEAPVKAIITIGDNTNTAVEISGYKNLIPLIKTEVKGNTLRVYTDVTTHFDTDKDVEVRISTPGLNKLEVTGAGVAEVLGGITTDKFDLEITGAGNVTIEQINSNSFNADLSGAGILNVKGGTVEKLVYEVTGAGEITSFPLVSQQATAHVTGAGDVELNATRQLDAHITGAGSISYKGNPSIKQKITGVGAIENAN